MRILLRIFLALLAAGLGPAASAGDWEWTTPKPTGNDHRGVAWNGTQYIAVGRLGTVVRSANGASWSRVPGSAIPAAIHKTLDLNGVAANGAVAVAVGEDGKIMRSANGGASWSLVTAFSPAVPTDDFKGVAYGGTNTFIAVIGSGSTGAIYRSADNGSSWTRVTVAGLSNYLYAVAWNGSRFAAVGQGGTILVSSDGTGANWNPAVVAGVNTDLLTIAGGGNRFVVGGLAQLGEGMIVRFDGSVWARITRLPTPIQPYALQGAAIQGTTAIVAGRFAPGGSNAIVHSFDVSAPAPMVTTNTASGIRGQALAAVSKGNQVVVVGENGSLSSSADGTSWSFAQQNQGQKQIRGIARGGNNYIAVASRELLHSTDGKSWTRRTGPAGGTPQQLSMDMHGAAYGRGKFVVVGGHSGGAPIISLPTGSGTVTQEFQASNFLPTLSAVAYAPEFDLFVAVGKTTTSMATPPIHRTVFVSKTGSSWEAMDMGMAVEPLNSSLAHLYGIAWNATNDVFVAVGTTGSQAIAITGQVTMGPGGPQITWTQRGTLNTVLSNLVPKGIAWSATSNLFVVTAPGGITVRNPGNDSGWTANTTTPGSYDLHAIAWNSSRNEFLVAGDQSSVWTLVPPATSWTRVVTGAQGDPSGDVFHAALWDGRAYHVGGSDTVVSHDSDTMSKILRIDPDVIFEHDFELP